MVSLCMCPLCAAAGSECYLNSTQAPDMVGVFAGTASAYNSFTPAAWSSRWPAYKVGTL